MKQRKPFLFRLGVVFTALGFVDLVGATVGAYRPASSTSYIVAGAIFMAAGAICMLKA